VTAPKRWLLGCSALIVIAVLSHLLATAWYRLPAGWQLEAVRWRVQAETEREDLARSFLARHRVEGMPREQVLAELGEPTETWDYWEYAVSSAGLGRGYESSVPRYADAPVLIVRFSANGREVVELTGVLVPEQSNPIEFSAEDWKSYTFFADQRRALADALIRSQLLRGASRAEVWRALGAPDFAERRLEYRVGQRGSGYGRYLVFELDEVDQVIRATLSDAKDG
jgi:hypothetical protein